MTCPAQCEQGTPWAAAQHCAGRAPLSPESTTRRDAASTATPLAHPRQMRTPRALLVDKEGPLRNLTETTT